MLEWLTIISELARVDEIEEAIWKAISRLLLGSLDGGSLPPSRGSPFCLRRHLPFK